MANLHHIARPYARAAFEFARSEKALPKWRDFLQTASEMSAEPAVMQLIANPQMTSAELFSLYEDILGQTLDAKRKNFLELLAENKRLNLLPSISTLFNGYYDALEKLKKVRVVTATESKEVFRKALIATLEKKLQCDVTLACEVDPSLIGGAIIHIGDRVIDGSVRGKLTRLLENFLR